MTMWLLSYMGRVKFSSFFSKKRYSKDKYIVPKQLKGTKQEWALFTDQTSYNINDITECAPGGNLTLMAQGAKQDLFCIS